MRTCKHCGNTKEECEFRASSKGDRLRSECRDCHNKNSRITKKERIWHAHRLTDKDYEVLREQSNGCCSVCGCTGELCIDHSHTTGNIRGLLCQSCNKALGLFKDNPVYLRNAANYIETDNNRRQPLERVLFKLFKGIR